LSLKRKLDGIAWLASMKFAINLLILIGVVMCLGTFIPQGQTPAFYHHNYGDILGSIIIFLALDNLYQAWWFYVLIALLCVAIVFCASQRLRKTHSLPGIGSLVFHVAIVLTLFGATWSLGYARSAGVDMVEGQTVSLAQLGLPKGDLTLNSFNIDYYPDYEPRQYTSDLSLSGYEGQNYEEQIYVNKPLRAGNLKVYQGSWGWMVQLYETSPTTAAITLKNYDVYTLDAVQDLAVRAIFIPDYAEDEQGVFSRSPLPNNPRLGLTLLQGDKIIDVAVIAPGQEAQLGGYKFGFQNFSYYSGLLIKEDPGVKLVFLGFGLMLLGLLGRYGRLFFTAEGE